MFEDSPPERICVVRLSHIGDTCHALAVVRAIQDTWPETGLTWIIGKTEASLMGDIPGIEFIIFDKGKGRAAYRDVATRLDGKIFDAALCMHASMRVNRIYRLIDTPVKLGFDRQRARDFQWLFTNRRIDSTSNQHVLDGMMSFARHLGVPERPLRWDIPLSDAHREFAARHIGAAERAIVISPCSSNRLRNFRNWSAENYAAAANHARKKYDCRIILTGGSSDLERQYGIRIRDLCGPDVVNLVGKTTLKELLAVIEASDLVIAPDSGPVHMATTVGTPVIGLYATSNPGRTGPYLHRHLTVNRYPDATGRFLGKSPDRLRWGQRVRDPRAMDLIRLRDVNEKIDHFFGT
jgi:heptosyltransferase I